MTCMPCNARSVSVKKGKHSGPFGDAANTRNGEMERAIVYSEAIKALFLSADSCVAVSGANRRRRRRRRQGAQTLSSAGGCCCCAWVVIISFYGPTRRVCIEISGRPRNSALSLARVILGGSKCVFLRAVFTTRAHKFPD